MTYIQRELQAQILNETPPKAIVIFGARQIGKTTLLTELAKTESSVRWFNGDVFRQVETNHLGMRTFFWTKFGSL